MSEIAESGGQSVPADGWDGEGLERRLRRSMAVITATAVLLSIPLAPWRVTTGLLLGGALAFFNHHWLRAALGSVLGGAATGTRPRLGAARYVLRYFVVGAVVASAYLLDLISVGATLAGLCSFAAAIMVEAFVQLYYAVVYREDG
ncbi:MAG TPA: ATP synthase subunit I [Pyrinomonadaceae bacterium]